jgi:glycine/D-amino acid oxidase-like deaminating enzyme
MIDSRPYWWDTVVAPHGLQEPMPGRVDVAVVGGGITGLCAARALAKRGVTVAVLEARTLGWGASSRNGGMVLTGLKIGARTLIARYGRELAARLFDASLEAVRLVGDIVDDEHIECDYTRCGHLALAAKPAHFRDFVESADWTAREFGHTSRVLPRAELSDEVGTQAYHGGLIDAASAGLNPAQYVVGLARAASAAGATLHEGAAISRIERHGAGWRVTSARGALEAGDVFVATSGYTSAVTGALRRRIMPIGSYVIATEPLTDAIARELSPRGRMMYDSWHFLHYFRLTPDRRLLFGGRARFVPETASTVRSSAAVLRASMVRLFPQLRDVRVDYAWGGTLDFPFDQMPHAGQIDGCHHALGYAGHGVALATYLGTRMGEALGASGVDDIPFARLPFPGAPLGLYRERPWFLPFVAAGYKLLDWIS